MALYLGHCLGPRADLELLINVADVEVDGVPTDRKLLGNSASACSALAQAATQ